MEAALRLTVPIRLPEKAPVLSKSLATETGFLVLPPAFAIFRGEPEEERPREEEAGSLGPREAGFPGFVDDVEALAAVDPVCRFNIDLAPAWALAELNPDPLVDPPVPARVEECELEVPPVARVTALTLLTLPFALVTWFEIQ
jgi:hypothetical protein